MVKGTFVFGKVKSSGCSIWLNEESVKGKSESSKFEQMCEEKLKPFSRRHTFDAFHCAVMEKDFPPSSIRSSGRSDNDPT